MSDSRYHIQLGIMNPEPRTQNPERGQALIKQLNAKINIQASSLTILKELSKDSEDTYLFGGCVRDACYSVLFENDNYSKPTDSDLLTTANESQIKKRFPKLYQNPIAENVFSCSGENYSDRIDIRCLPTSNMLFVKKDMKKYFDITINSILYNSTQRLIDPSGKGLVHLQDKIIDVFSPYQRSDRIDCLVRALRFQLRFDFKLSDKTFDAMVAQLPQGLYDVKNPHRMNMLLLKIFLGGEAKKILSRLLQPLSDNTRIYIVDLLFSPAISHALKTACQDSNKFNYLADIFEKTKKKWSIVSIYCLLLVFAEREKNLSAEKNKEYLKEIVDGNILFKAALTSEPIKLSMSEYSLFKKAVNNHRGNNKFNQLPAKEEDKLNQPSFF
jgi:tRNA nucleotidyltransferase/poly(A) polymerase